MFEVAWRNTGEEPAAATARMASVTGRAVVTVVLHISMGSVSVGLGVGMAINATEDGIVVLVCMAARARHPDINPVTPVLDGEPLLFVLVDEAGIPVGGGVAEIASRRVSLVSMRWIVGSVEIRLMTVNADRGRVGVATIHMTSRASHLHMSAGQLVSHRSMVELSGIPSSGRMTDGAIVIVVPINVARIADAIEGRHVTGKAVPRNALELPIDMTNVASHRTVSPGQGESRPIMVNLRRMPGVGRMANRAVVVIVVLNVIRIAGAVEDRHVASEAVGRSVRKLPVNMAVCASHRPVRAG